MSMNANRSRIIQHSGICSNEEYSMGLIVKGDITCKTCKCGSIIVNGVNLIDEINNLKSEISELKYQINEKKVINEIATQTVNEIIDNVVTDYVTLSTSEDTDKQSGWFSSWF